MPKIGRWVTKAEATREMDISLATLDRMMRTGEVEYHRQRGRVYVLVHGPEIPSDGELLERARADLAESDLTVSELRKEVRRLENGLHNRAKEALAAERRASLAETEVSAANARASAETGRADDLERQLESVRRNSGYLLLAFIVGFVIVAMLFVLMILL